jgi:hypothetical protein
MQCREATKPSPLLAVKLYSSALQKFFAETVTGELLLSNAWVNTRFWSSYGKRIIGPVHTLSCTKDHNKCSMNKTKKQNRIEALLEC